MSDSNFVEAASKLKDKWQGPYEVLKSHDFGMVEIKNLRDGRVY